MEAVIKRRSDGKIVEEIFAEIKQEGSAFEITEADMRGFIGGIINGVRFLLKEPPPRSHRPLIGRSCAPA